MLTYTLLNQFHSLYPENEGLGGFYLHHASQPFLYLSELQKSMFDGSFDVTDDTIETDGPDPS